MEKLKQIITKTKEFLKGKKSYVIAIAVAILGVLQGLDIFTLPAWAWPILGAAGLGALKGGIDRTSEEVKTEIKDNSEKQIVINEVKDSVVLDEISKLNDKT
jgi:hypothetical protein